MLGAAKQAALLGTTAMASPLPRNLLSDFESTAGWTPSSAVAVATHAGPRKVLGSAGLQITANGTNISQSVTRTALTSADPAAWGVVALCVDAGTDPGLADTGSVRPQFRTGATTYALQVDSGVAGTSFPAHFNHWSRGKRWVSVPADSMRVSNWSGARLTAAGAVAKDAIISINGAASTAFAGNLVVDALCVPAPHRPCVMISFDDGNVGQFTNAFPIMAARGLVGTVYIPWSMIGGSLKMTKAHLRALQGAGWAMCLDSAAGDEPLTAFPSVAAALAQINTMRDQVAAEFGSDGVAHLCYSYGVNCYPDVPKAFSVTPNGTDTVSVGATNAYSFLSAGMVVKGTGVSPDPRVISCPSQATVKLDRAVPAGGAATWTFCARTKGVTVTCNGTTTVTMASTANLFDGQHMCGYTVPADTTITVTSATTVTTSNPVPASCIKANFEHKSGEFYVGKMADALIAAGYQSARRVQTVGGVYTGYGIDPLVAMDMPGMTIDSGSVTTALAIANLTAALAAREDVLCYMHYTTSQDDAHFTTLMDWLAAQVAAGACDVVTVPEWYRRARARASIA